MDIDFDDLDVPSRAPDTKPEKFAPKNSKCKLVGTSELDTSKSNSTTVCSKTEIEQPWHTVPTVHDAYSSRKNDTDATDMEIDMDWEQDKEDEVVREIDVFFTSPTDADSKLYILQNPLRPGWRPDELENKWKVRVRPGSSEVEIEMPIEVESENWKAPVDDKIAMLKQVLSTVWTPSVSCGDAIGILTNNKLYLNPVHAVVQLRPSTQHLMYPNAPHDGARINIEKSLEQVKKQGKLPEARAVTEQNANTEQWIPLKYYGYTSLLSQQYMEDMVAHQDSQIQFSMSQSDYIGSLCPAASGKFKPKRSPQSDLRKLSFEECFKGYLLEGPSAKRFSTLKDRDPNASDEDIFKVLKEHAVLIQGLWVANSKLKLPTNEVRDSSLRDYAMLQFSKSRIFHVKLLPKQTALSNRMNIILSEFATKSSLKEWKFREPPDKSFIKKYPEIVKNQQENWDKVGKGIMERVSSLESNKTHVVPTQKMGVFAPTPNRPSRVPTRATSIPPSKELMSDRDQEVLSSTLKTIFQDNQVCSINHIRKRLLEISENTQLTGTREVVAAAAADASQKDLEKIINRVAVEVHGSFVLKSSPYQPELDPVRHCVIKRFQQKGPGARLKRSNIYSIVKVELKKDLDDDVYEKVMKELCISDDSEWVLRGTDN